MPELVAEYCRLLATVPLSGALLIGLFLALACPANKVVTAIMLPAIDKAISLRLIIFSSCSRFNRGSPPPVRKLDFLPASQVVFVSGKTSPSELDPKLNGAAELLRESVYRIAGRRDWSFHCGYFSLVGADLFPFLKVYGARH